MFWPIHPKCDDVVIRAGDGLPTDYGRWVGDHPNIFWSVSIQDHDAYSGKYLGGAKKSQYTAPKELDQPPPHELMTAREAFTEIQNM